MALPGNSTDRQAIGPSPERRVNNITTNNNVNTNNWNSMVHPRPSTSNNANPFYSNRTSSVPDVSNLAIYDQTNVSTNNPSNQNSQMTPNLNNNANTNSNGQMIPPSSNHNTPNHNNNNTPTKKPPKICYECGKSITFTLVRAMDRIYHIECFRCYDCGKECSNKFFTIDVDIDQHTKEEVPLCEYDYFKRIDLICGNCDKAIRGPYISAINKKFHPEHFFCEICHKIFESEDYYESNNSIFCHYHFSKLHAFHCEACNSAILKQYVQMCRGGKEQQWHPECFMIHKFWGVSIEINCIGLVNNQFYNSIEDSNIDPKDLFDIEKKLERITMSIWLTLSEFEESCANCISEMLHFASIGNHLNGLLNTGKLILKIECLFKGIDFLNDFSKNVKFDIFENNTKISNLLKEPRSMSSKIMSYLTFLRDTDKLKITTSKYSQELLLLISNLAHYLKLISRNSLYHAIELNKLTKSTIATDRLLREISNHDSVPNDVFPILNIASNSKDLCFECSKNIEQECIQFEDKRWHVDCLKCHNCEKLLVQNNSLDDSTFNTVKNIVLCDSCSTNDVDSKTGFKRVSRFLQLIYLLKIALIRSRHSMKKKGQIQSNSVMYVSPESGDTSMMSLENDEYNKNVSDITRKRSIRENQTINNVTNRNRDYRKSIIIEAPEASSAETEKLVASNKKSIKSLKKEIYSGKKGSKKLKIVDEPIISNSSHYNNNHNNKYPSNITNTANNMNHYQNERTLASNSSSKYVNPNIGNNSSSSSMSSFINQSNNNLFITSNLLKNEKSLTLDDIPRIVSSEQAREHRPNAFKYQKRVPTASSTLPVAKPFNSSKNPELQVDLDAAQPPPVPPNPKFSPNTEKTKGKFDQHQQKKQQTHKQLHQHQPSDLAHDGKSYLVPVDLKNGALLDTRIASSSIKSGAGTMNPNGDVLIRFSELDSNEHTILRHISAFALNKLLNNSIPLDDCLLFIDVRKNPGFWERLFNGNSQSKENNTTNSNKVFGVALETLVKKYGVESDLGVGSEKLKIPIFIDEIINVMRNMDLSVEGIFRINGNIRRLKQLVEEIDKSPTKMPDFSKEVPVQVAALLKKFLREMPTPLLTFALYDLFITSQKALTEDNDDKMKMCILRLAYAMLPKPQRDLTEVLLNFFAWVATFAQIDADTGSKMDTHNLATVLTPNILHSKPPAETNGYPSIADSKSENNFLAIEVVNTLIEQHQKFTYIPKELVEFYNLAGFGKLVHEEGTDFRSSETKGTASSGSALSSKEIINKCQAAFAGNNAIFDGLFNNYEE